jgi:hypothetical protein
MPNELHRLAETAVDQHGNVTDAQARLAGLSGRRLRHHLDDGTLERSGAHVLRSPFVGRTPLRDLAAFVLDCGREAVASGPSAAALHGFDGFVLHPPFHATVCRGRFVERPPHQVHTTIELPLCDRTLVEGIATMSAARAIIDLSRFVGPATLTRALDGALRDRKLTEDLLHTRIAELRSRGRHGIPKLLAVIDGAEAARGAHSWLERRFLRICADFGLPRPMTQQVLTSSKGRLVRVDFRFPHTAIVVEVLGYHWHRGSREQFSRDAERLNALVRAGLQPLQFTYDHVTLDARWVANELASALDLPSVSGSST